LSSPKLAKLDPDNLSVCIPKYKNWISEESWSHWQNFLDHDIIALTTVSQPHTDAEWYLDVLKAASSCETEQTDTGTSSALEGVALEEMLSEEQITTVV